MEGEQKKRNGFVDRLNSLYGASRLIRGPLPIITPWPLLAALVGVPLITLFIGLAAFSPAASSEQTTFPIGTISPNITGTLNIMGATESETTIINEALSLAFSYPGFQELISGGAVNVVLEKGLTWDGKLVDGYVLSKDQINIRSGLSREKLRYTFLHETGHIIAFRAPGVFNSFPHKELRNQDLSCYNFLGYLTSYPFGEGGGGAASVESFAEGVSLFLLYSERPVLSNFPDTCPKTYDWLRNNIFRPITQAPLP